MDRADLELQGFTDSNGRLNSYAGGGGAIWIPPDARIGSWPDEKGNMVECVIYPLPEAWHHDLPINNQNIDDLKNLHDLEEIGWQKMNNSSTVLEDFIRLAEATPDMIRQFVLKWGPLWHCVEHKDCFWVPTWYPNQKNGCRWFPAEPLKEFRLRAIQAEATFDIAVRLSKGRPVPMNLWQRLGWTGEEGKFSLWGQKFFLTSIINGFLTRPGGPSLFVYWNDQKPEIVIDTGLGFIRSVWLIIAQCLTGAKGLYFCNSCGDPYIRHMRKPQEGRKSFCPECSGNGKGSKKLYERFKRVHANKS